MTDQIIRLERDLNAKLRDMLPKLWPQGKDIWPPVWHRVENAVAQGTFDTFIGSSIGCGWIELKVAGPNAKPQMRPGQPGFGAKMLRAGVPAHVIACSKRGEVRLMRGETMGDDWRDHVLMRCDLRDMEAMRVVLVRCMTEA